MLSQGPHARIDGSARGSLPVQLRFRHIARNVLSNWLATAANMAVGFLLAPFIVHHLGNVAYGIWVLAISSVNYLFLLDLGMRSSVLRFVSQGHTVGDHAAASDALSAALWVRLQIGALVLVLSLGLAAVFPLLFRVPPEMATSARLAVSIIGVTTALGMSVGVFGGVVSALNRYDLQTLVTLVELAIRVTGVVLVLRRGYGIVAIAGCELLAAVAGNLLLLALARRIYPQLRVTLKQPQKAMLRSLWSYSLYAFLTSVAIQLVYQTDNLVVGTFVSASAVTFYSIGNSLCRYTDQFAGAMTSTFVPVASTYEAGGDAGRLQGLYRVGTRAMLALSLPIIVTLLFRGRTFIGLWMGPQYAQRSGTVLILLAIALLFSLANKTAAAIAFGTSRHKTMARWAIAEGVVNLGLSIALVHPFGIYGVAIGTLLPSLVVHLVLWPRYIAKLVGLGPVEVVAGVWGPMFLAALPYAGACYAVNRFYPAHTLAAFFLQTLILLPCFFLVLAGIFHNQLRSRLPMVRTLLARRIQPSSVE
jgi:O-antigen/teichoic acid export membrane protein